MELTSTDQIKYLITGIMSHPLIEIDYTCVGPNVNQLDENTLNQFGVKAVTLDLNTPEDELKIGNDLKNFDYMLIDRVLAKKADPVKYLKKCAQILRDDGLIIVNEVSKDYEISLFIDVLQGIDVNNSNQIYGSYFKRETLEKVFEEANYRICFRQVIIKILIVQYFNLDRSYN